SLSVVVFFIKVIDVLLKFPFSVTYRNFGFSLLPSFCGLLIGFYFLSKYYQIIFTLLYFILVLLFDNFSSILTTFIFVVACVIYKCNIEKHRREKHVYFVVFLPLILLLGLVLLFNMNAILSSLYNILYEAGYHSYSLLTLTRFTENWDFGSEF